MRACCCPAERTPIISTCWSAMATIAIMIGTPQGSRILAFASEREAAQAAEIILRQLNPLALPAPVWVTCGDPEVKRRLLDYLANLQAELIRI